MYFKDKRYIKIDNKPVFILYRSENIANCDKMIEYWNELAIQYGYDGIYIIEEKNGFQNKKCCNNSEAILYFEPMYTHTWEYKGIRAKFNNIYGRVLNKVFDSNCIWCNYDLVWNFILRRKSNIENKEYLGAFVDFDNTARKKKNSFIMRNTNPRKFRKYIGKLKTKAIKEKSDFVFLNAWNEWAEGCYLEPDQKNGFKYLEAVKLYFKNE